MNMQILNIVLYGHDGQKRVLDFKSGSVNVITGASKTGKSALIHIIDYCFGSGECHVPEGIIRKATTWFGVRLQIDNGQAFIARRCPARGSSSSEECFVEIGSNIELPEGGALRQTTNTEGLNNLLTSWCGITDNIHQPATGQRRAPLAANVRHALLLCFQPQDEIIRRNQLFHGCADNFVAQALKDVFPYLLGAVSDEYVRKREQLRLLREKLRICERKLAEMVALRGAGVSKAANLLAQARDCGLSTTTESENWDLVIAALRESASIPAATLESRLPDNVEFTRLSDERTQLLDQHRQLREQIAAARSFRVDANSYSHEATEQKSRLKSIGIFDGAAPGTSCPLCSHELNETNAPPTTEELKGALANVSTRLEAVTRSTPQMERVVAELEQKAASIQQKVIQNRSEMESVRAANDEITRAQDETSKRSYVLGRIGLYLESLPDLPDSTALEREAAEIRSQCDTLEEELSDDAIRERVESIVALLGGEMTDWARSLQLEHSTHPLRLNLKKLTIVADTSDGPIPMQRMGSGENWVGYHLIGHLALHKWFTQQNRPVPRFLFLDQPSQVYFPPERDLEGPLDPVQGDDRAALRRMFKLIFDVVTTLAPGFQVIITEHADINETWYQDSIVEKWRGGTKLIPDDWRQV